MRILTAPLYNASLTSSIITDIFLTLKEDTTMSFYPDEEENPDFSSVTSSSGGSLGETESTADQNTVENRTHTVESGDSLSKIAHKVYGDSNEWRKIFEANQHQLDDPDKIYPGQVLIIP